MSKRWLMLCVLICATSALWSSGEPYVSQCGQDRLLNECFFRNKKDGVSVAIGAHDGISGSNTYFFEKALGWTGICFEPMPNTFEVLTENRTCVCLNSCVANATGAMPFIWVQSKGGVDMLSGLQASYDPRHWARMQDECQQQGGTYKIIDVQAVVLNDILAQYNITTIDYLSVDTEGNELDILQSIDFDAITIAAISVENNYREPYIRNFLTSKGFSLVYVFMGFDELYINNYYLSQLYRSPQP